MLLLSPANEIHSQSVLEGSHYADSYRKQYDQNVNANNSDWTVTYHKVDFYIDYIEDQEEIAGKQESHIAKNLHSAIPLSLVVLSHLTFDYCDECDRPDD